jgi:hypothetical protein
MNSKIVVFVLFLGLFFSINNFWDLSGKNTSDIPENGYVPNAETAQKIAEAILVPIYGDEIYKERPFTAKLIKDIWVVRGTKIISNQSTHKEGVKYGYLGGTFYVEIRKSDCKILKAYHEK